MVITDFGTGITTRLYYEAHVTFEASSDDDWDGFATVVKELGWRASRFSDDDVDHYEGKWFISARHSQLDAIAESLRVVIKDLRSEGFNLTVVRYKLEETLLDSKYGDTLPGV